MINIGVFRRTGCRFYLRSGGTSPEVVYDGFGLTLVGNWRGSTNS